MDISTPIGIALAFGLILGSIMLNSSLGAYYDTPSVLIVAGGTVAAALISENLPQVKIMFTTIGKSFKKPPGDPVANIAKIVELSKIARREGILALESQKVDDPFLNKAIKKAVDSVPPDEIREALSAELLSMKDRHKRAQGLLKFCAATAPSMGMIGTLIGLVQMLQNLSDPSSIGPAMAVALLTTMYGAILAFVVFGPLAEKLGRWSDQEGASMTIVIEGVDGIVRGQNAMVIKDKLEARLSPKLRVVGDEG